MSMSWDFKKLKTEIAADVAGASNAQALEAVRLK